MLVGGGPLMDMAVCEFGTAQGTTGAVVEGLVGDYACATEVMEGASLAAESPARAWA